MSNVINLANTTLTVSERISTRTGQVRWFVNLSRATRYARGAYVGLTKQEFDVLVPIVGAARPMPNVQPDPTAMTLEILASLAKAGCLGLETCNVEYRPAFVGDALRAQLGMPSLTEEQELADAKITVGASTPDTSEDPF